MRDKVLSRLFDFPADALRGWNKKFLTAEQFGNENLKVPFDSLSLLVFSSKKWL
jgi:hypothetical protein